MSTLQALVSVNTNYTRSINIERDGEDAAFQRPYIVTNRARLLLERIAASLRNEDVPRAWSIVGPYGAGKSAFGLYISRLLGAPTSAGYKYASGVLKQSDAGLYAAFSKLQRNSSGFCSIALTGSPEPLAQRLVRAMLPAAEGFFSVRRGRNPKIVDELRAAVAQKEIGVSAVIDLMTKLQESVSRAEGRGVLLVIDELGKFLEFEARHRGATDIYLLQALAEHSVRKGTMPLVLIVLLHQTIEQYSQSLGEQLRNEWKKVQGRFETIPFLESTEQTIRVVGAAISSRLPARQLVAIGKEAAGMARRLSELGALPIGLAAKEATSLFVQCYPLHPISLLILPTLCQRVAQNERTLFSYLGSQEPFGFMDAMARLDVEETGAVKWIRPSKIYEYFILNQPGLMSDQGTHRRWAEVLTALERLGDAPASEIETLKTIGLLNIIGAQAGLKASNEILSLCSRSADQKGKAAKSATNALMRRSIISYRRFNHEYRVWQGSDFDIDVALRDQRAQLGRIDAAEILNELLPLPPLVARRHAIRTGTLRYFSLVFVSAASRERIDRTDSPTIFVCLAESSEEVGLFREAAAGIGVWHTLAVICDSGALIGEAVTDVLALRRIQRQSPELANDPVAQRELGDRLSSAMKNERSLIATILEDPDQFEWIVGGGRAGIRGKRDLQIQLSDLLDEVYSRAPIIRNELVNRGRPSSTAVAGRKKLLLAMLEQPKAADLGIDKFPAEKAMYRAVLRATGLHAIRDGEWRFQAPGSDGEDPARLGPMWNAALDLIESSPDGAVSLSAIYDVLSKPPYGIKAGLFPILTVAMYQAMRQELALTENRQFVPFLTVEVLEGLIKNPNVFAFQRVRSLAESGRLFELYAEAITGEVQRGAGLMSVLQPLAKLMMGLPDYTKRTKRLSAEARTVRDLFFSSKMPVELVHKELPGVFGVALTSGTDDPEALTSFLEKFKETLTELRVAYHALLNDIVEQLKSAFALEAKLGLHEVRDVIRSRCLRLDAYTIDPECKAFIGRLVDPFGDEAQWLVSLASFLARKPPEKWLDEDLDAAGFRLTELASRVRDLRRLQLHHEGAHTETPGDLEASLIRIVSTRDGERHALVTLDKSGRATVQDRVGEIQRILDSLPNNDLKLATIAKAFQSLMHAPNIEDKSDEVPSNKSDKKGAA